MSEILSKLLNPFGVKVTKAGTQYLAIGTLTTIVLHGLFYGALFHFIAKVW
jgi:hypothetical protein